MIAGIAGLGRHWPWARPLAPIPAVAAAVALVVVSGCTGSGEGQSDQSLSGLVHASRSTERPIDMANVGRDATELLRAARAPHHVLAEAIGAHRFRGTSSIRVEEGGQNVTSVTSVESLAVTSSIDYEADGDFHALVENSADYGRTVYYSGGYLYLAPRYATKLHRRLPTSEGEPAAIADDIFAELGAYLDIFRDGIEVAEKGVARLGSRSVRTIEIKKAPKQRRPPPRPRIAGIDSHPQRAWRDSIIVNAIAGELLIDEETGAALAGHLEGTVTMSRDGRTFTMTLAARRSLDDIGGSVAVIPPADEQWVSTPERLREVDERDMLLQGIAPAARRSKAPAAGVESLAAASGSSVSPSPPRADKPTTQSNQTNQDNER